MREINNIFKGNEISIICVSVYHNIIITGSRDNQMSHTLYLWNYEYCKIIASLELDK